MSEIRLHSFERSRITFSLYIPEKSLIKTLFLWIIAKNERKNPECITITLRVKQKLEFLSKVGARIALIKKLE